VSFPPGWSYARVGEIALAVSESQKAVLGFASRDAASDEAVHTTLERLLGALGVEEIRWQRIKQRLNRPESEIDGKDGVNLALWEVDAKSQWGKKPRLGDQGTGTLLIVVAKLKNEAVIMGAGFVVKPDAEAEAPAIMAAVQSLQVTP
jgi:hypothetical protein